MLGLAFLFVIVAVLCGIGIYKHGWKSFIVALSALGVGLYAGGEQMIDAFKAFFGG